MSLQPGMQAGDYEVLAELGAGGMGKVFKVRNVISDRVEAMKVLLPDLMSNTNLADRFLREIKVQAALEHPNIAGLRTALRFENQLLMVMEFVEGRTMDSWMAQGAIPMQNAVWVTMQVLEALEYAHSRGIVHRDIKPSNIMITSAGVVKLMDFGIAKVMDDPSLTQTHQTTGSLYYMSPEQINGQPLDGRSDLYSLGVTLYQFVTGKRPFDAPNTYGIMAAHLTQTPQPPVDVDPTLPAGLSQIILMALAKDPGARFQSAGAFRQALAGVLEQLRQPGAQPGAAMAAAGAPEPAYNAAPQAPAPQVRPGMSSRTLYMLAGSLATVCVIVVLALQGPKFFRTSAQQEPPAQQVVEPLAQTPAAAPAAADPTATAGDPQPAPATPEAGAGARPGSNVAQPASAAGGRRHAAISADAAQSNVAKPAAAAPISNPGGNVAPPAAPQAEGASAPAATAPAPDRAALSVLRRRMMQMAQRFSATQAAYKSLQQQMAQEGLRPRGDLGSLSQRVTFEMDEAEDALKNNDASQAGQHLDNAERALEQLEKFFRL
jgi:eukaryotic-like serine/threonine-protein kinase